jgi:hypothetical protein
MAIITSDSITEEALKILNKAFHDSYTSIDREKRERIGGNEAAHAARPRASDTQHSKADQKDQNI